MALVMMKVSALANLPMMKVSAMAKLPRVQVSAMAMAIFIILAQIFKQSVRNKSAVSEHSERNQRALRASK